MFRKRIPVVAMMLVAGCSGPTKGEQSGAAVPQPAAGSGSPFVVKNQPAPPRSSVPQQQPDQTPVAAPPCAAAAPGYSDADVLKLVEADTAAVNSAAASQTIYVNISHLAEGRSECDMNFYRFGVGQMFNMVSWSPNIVAPKFIDSNNYIARVDVRDLTWDADALPYMLSAAKRGDYGIMSAEPTKPAVVRGDWLAQQMTRPAVYGYIMRNQLFERQMEEQAKVDNSKPGKFGGVYESIVAQNPRILERRESEYGACWISHDFLYRTQATAALDTGELPQDDVRFAAQQYIAREYICVLPNGMQAYQLTGFVSQRRWDANSCLAQNENREDKRVLNGQCFNCHADGLIRFEDKVRGGRPDSELTAHIKANYPEQAELEALFDKDQALYVKANSQIPFYDPNYTTPLNELIEIYGQRAKDDMRESSAGTFGAFLYNSASGGPLWDDVFNPIASSAVGLGILIPGKFLYEEIPELVIPAYEQLYQEHGVDENEGCTAD
jgi:hypothetical protein